MNQWLIPLRLCFSDLLLSSLLLFTTVVHNTLITSTLRHHDFLCVFWQQEEIVKCLHFPP